MKNNKQFAVIGLGRFGRAVVETLVASGYDVMGCRQKYGSCKANGAYCNRCYAVRCNE